MNLIKNKNLMKFFHVTAYLAMIVSFLIPDYVLRRWIYAIGFVELNEAGPYLFTIAWTFIFTAIIFQLPQKAGKITYSILTIFWYFVASAQYIYYKIFGKMIWVKDVMVAKEGSDFATYVISKLDYRVFFLVFACIFFVVYACIFYKKSKKVNYKIGIPMIAAAVVLIAVTPKTFGETGELNWDSWKNKRYVYESFSDQNKTMQLSGLYQYSMRDVYQTFIKANITNAEAYKEIDAYYENKPEFQTNDYTGMFEGKNVIVVMMESMDDWVISEKATPALHYLMNNSINFDRYFAPVFGAGGTFNAEFTMNTGFHSPNSGNAAYAFNKNSFPYSLANVFKDNGYHVNSFHYNTGEFYNRTNMHETFGYEKHYSFLDMGYEENDAIFDSILTSNKGLYQSFINKEEPFLSFFVTYSNHLQYNLDNYICKVNSEKYSDIWDESMDEELNCLNVQVKETDTFFEQLLTNLYEDDLLEDTVIVAFTDHLLYGAQQDVSTFNKEYEEGLTDCIPFFIYDYESQTKMKVDKVLNNTDLLPTVLNLFGFQPVKYYLGNDAFDPNYSGYTFYSNYAWYDGEIFNDGSIEDVNDYMKQMNETIMKRININTKILESDYFSYLEDKKG